MGVNAIVGSLFIAGFVTFLFIVLINLIMVVGAQFYGHFLRRIRDGDFLSDQTGTDLEQRVRNGFRDPSLQVVILDEMTELSSVDFEKNILPTLPLPASEVQAGTSLNDWRDRVRQQFHSNFYYHPAEGQQDPARLFVNTGVRTFGE